MNVDERKLIADLFDRMRGMRGIEKDVEAADLIEREAAANSDAVYLLTQSVLVQEQALQKANARIQELETAGETESGTVSTGAAQPRKSAGFGRPSATSVPAAGGAMSSPGLSPQMSRQAKEQSDNNRGLSGSFMGQAMTTAAGVAGGMLLANGISSLFSGSQGSSASASETASAEATPASDEQPAAEEAELQNASSDAEEGSWFGGDDWGDFGGDLEL